MAEGISNDGLPQSAGMAPEALTLPFQLYAALVIAATYRRTGLSNVAVAMLVMPVPTWKVDGITIQPGDELVLVQAADLASVNQPRAGDYLVETVSNLRRDVVVAQLDLSRQIWSLVARKNFS